MLRIQVAQLLELLCSCGVLPQFDQGQDQPSSIGQQLWGVLNVDCPDTLLNGAPGSLE